MVRIVEYESLWDNLGMSDIIYKYIIPERLWLNLWALRFLPLYYFLRGAAPKKIVGSGRNRRPIDSTGASKKGMIYLFYIPHQQHLWKLPVTFTFLCWSLLKVPLNPFSTGTGWTLYKFYGGFRISYGMG